MFLQRGDEKGRAFLNFRGPFVRFNFSAARQHKRFITGTTDFKDFTTLPNNGQRILFAIVDLAPRIAPEHLPGFNEFKNVPVVATIQSAVQ